MDQNWGNTYEVMINERDSHDKVFKELIDTLNFTQKRYIEIKDKHEKL